MKFSVVHLLVIGASLGLPVAEANSQARDNASSKLMFSNELKTFNISPASLDLVLQQFELETGIRISYPQSLVDRRFSRGAQGSYSTEQALKRLLSGTGITFKLNAAGALQLEALPENPADDIPHIEILGFYDESRERQNLASAKIVIGSEELQSFADASMGEVIRRMPSVSFGGPPGENNDARLRGLHKDYTQILIDGRPVPGRDFAIDQIPASQVERVEIIRSTTANIDSQGIAGAVNIVMKKVPAVSSTKWKLGVGSMPKVPGTDDTGQVSLSHSGKTVGFGYSLNASAQQRLGYRTKDRKDYSDDSLSRLTNREQDEEVRQHDELALSSRLEWQLSADSVLQFDPKFIRSNEDKERHRFKKADLTDQERMDASNNRDYLAADLIWQRTLSDSLQMKWYGNVQQKEEHKQQTDLKGKANETADKLKFATGSDTLLDESSVSIGNNWDWIASERHSWDFGLELLRSQWDQNKQSWKKADQSDLLYQSAKVEEQKVSGYLQHEFYLNESHIVTTGGRLEHVSGDADYQNNAATLTDDLHFNPSVHWLYKLASNTNLRTSVSRSIKRPKFDDLVPLTDMKSGTLSDPDKMGNPDLKPEKAWGAESSVEHYFDEKGGVVTANLFVRKMTDLVESVTFFDETEQRWITMPVNREKGKFWGLELDGSKKLDQFGLTGLTLRGNYSWLRSSTFDEFSGVDRPINEQPNYIMNAGFDYNLDALNSQFGMSYNRVGSSEKHDLRGNDKRVQKQAPSHYLDTFWNWKITSDLNLRLSAVNLLEIEKNRPRTTTDADGKVVMFEQEDEKSARSFQVTLEGKF
ncbi:TonB-dependent receptor [Rheinheimera soli]|uniref:Iron complex outermembrane receptor protein n=1 Tax=Rheinheimera soli TaxID=443616 RepID=A0ABU1W0A7_9GAMM|nr:TonB-dependent receptor [Rheinheimera soli]MDR7121402.1 iron complex outermembrane receptor protein [Rheinheimera soli]